MLASCSESENPSSENLTFIVTVPTPVGPSKVLFGSKDYFVLTITGSETRFDSDPVAIKPRENFQYEIAYPEFKIFDGCENVTVEAFYRNKSFHKRNFELNPFPGFDQDQCKDGWKQVVNIVIPS